MHVMSPKVLFIILIMLAFEVFLFLRFKVFLSMHQNLLLIFFSKQVFKKNIGGPSKQLRYFPWPNPNPFGQPADTLSPVPYIIEGARHV